MPSLYPRPPINHGIVGKPYSVDFPFHELSFSLSGWCCMHADSCLPCCCKVQVSLGLVTKLQSNRQGVDGLLTM